MAKGEGDGGSRKAVAQGMRMPLLITLIVVGVVAGLYFAYYRNQVAYHTGRKFVAGNRRHPVADCSPRVRWTTSGAGVCGGRRSKLIGAFSERRGETIEKG